MDCPSCSWELEQQRSDEVDHHVCPLCAGLLVPILRSMALFRAWEDTDVEDPAELPADIPEAAQCPQCGDRLEAFGYMESPVQVARCNTCRLLWVPGMQRNPVRNQWRKAQGRAEKHMKAREVEASTAWKESMGPRKRGRRRAMDAKIRSDLHKLKAWEIQSKRFRDDD